MYVFANILQPLIDVFEWVLLRIHDVVSSWGLSIIILTVIIRACLLPLTIRQFRSMQKLQKLAPKMKELQAKYADDKQRLNQEMMKFYRENQVNPASSCLPLVAQIPVFISLFYMLRADLREDICGQTRVSCGDVPIALNPHPGAEKFLFIPDLTDNATGTVLIVLLVLYVGSQLFSTLLMSTTTDPKQRLIFLALPFVFVAFIINFPAGLLVYWITTNLWTIVQQVIIRRRVGPIRPPELAAEGGGGLLGMLRGPSPAAGGAGGGGAGTSGGSAPAGERKPGFLERLAGGGATSAARGDDDEGAQAKSGDGKSGDGKSGAQKVPAKAAAKGGGGGQQKPRRAGPPPSSPRKKKKRSGRRR